MAKLKPNDVNFTQALARLEEIVEKLESPDLDLEESLKLLEEGVKLHKLCKAKLTEASTKITTILKEDSPKEEGWVKISDTQIAKVTHYYNKITVAVLKITKGDLKVGDKIKLIDKDGGEFTQTVKSMQIEHADIEIAKKGDEFGLKVEKEPKVPSPVTKIND